MEQQLKPVILFKKSVPKKVRTDLESAGYTVVVTSAPYVQLGTPNRDTILQEFFNYLQSLTLNVDLTKSQAQVRRELVESVLKAVTDRENIDFKELIKL